MEFKNIEEINKMSAEELEEYFIQKLFEAFDELILPVSKIIGHKIKVPEIIVYDIERSKSISYRKRNVSI